MKGKGTEEITMDLEDLYFRKLNQYQMGKQENLTLIKLIIQNVRTRKTNSLLKKQKLMEYLSGILMKIMMQVLQDAPLGM